MKNGFLISIFVLFSSFSYSQNSNVYDQLELLLDKSNNGVNARLKHVLRTEFSQIINTNSNGLIGNYVGLSTKDNTLAFGFNKVLDRAFLEINASGSVNDNIAGIFEESRLKSEIKIGFRYHKIFRIKKIKLYIFIIIEFFLSIRKFNNYEGPTSFFNP